jgi:methenyltetrahydromethanopterin cyclohydrolase
LKLNERAIRVACELIERADELGAIVHTIGGATVIDAGVAAAGSLGAGVLLARACLSDLADVSLSPGRLGDFALPQVTVAVHQPVAACMASQYAGWQLSVGGYFAMGSGPMRAAYGKEELFNDAALSPLREKPTCAVGVLETAKLPDDAVIAYIAQRAGVAAENLTLLAAKTASLAGGVQVVARSVETALHKLHALHVDLSRVVAGFGSAPLPPVAKSDSHAIGRTNDAVLYGGQVVLYVRGDDDSLEQAGAKLPSSASSDYGRPFREIFKRYNHDFYKIDPMLFSPAHVTLQNIETGRSFAFGKVNEPVLLDSFFT